MRAPFLLAGAIVIAACATKEDTGTSGSRSTAHAGVCDPNHQGDALNKLFSSPVIPSQMFNGVDPTGDEWSGLSFDDMEKAYCAGDLQTEDEQTAVVAWDNTVQVEYTKSNRRVDQFSLYPGYRGTLDFASRPTALEDPSKPNPFGTHTYSIGVAQPILRDGSPWTINWDKNCTDAPGDCLEKQATEIFDALMFTFGRELPSTQDSCKKLGICIVSKLDGFGGVIGARPLGIYFQVPEPTGGGALSSTPGQIYGFPIKFMPFSLADSFLKLDAEGPVAIAPDLGDRHSRCEMRLGMTFDAFLQSCTYVFADTSRNDLLKKKLLGGATRGIAAPNGLATGALSATWALEISGLHPDFASDRFDETEPAPTAKATGLVLNDRWLAKPLNDYSADGSTLTLEGTGVIYREYARLVQDFVHHEMDPSLPRFAIGDPQCVAEKPARGCTGFEQFVTPADPTASAQNALRVSTQVAQMLGLKTVFHTDNVTAAFCPDPTNFDTCETGRGLFDETRQRLIDVLGGGDLNAIPASLRDRKLYVRLWGQAFVKYLRAASQHPSDLSDARYDAFTPQDKDLTVEPVRDDLVALKYANRFEYRVSYLSSIVDRIVFH